MRPNGIRLVRSSPPSATSPTPRSSRRPCAAGLPGALLTGLTGLWALAGCGDSAGTAPSSVASNADVGAPARADTPAAQPEYLVERLEEMAQGGLDYDSVAYHCEFCETVVTRDDELARATGSGIVWYGLWEDAVAEVERTGRPMLLHMGSPRCLEVPGVW